jgi:hypothetical protein
MREKLTWRIALLLAAGLFCWNISRAVLACSDELTPLWTDLGSDDPVMVQRTIAALVARPRETVPFAQRHLKPVPRLCPRQLTRLIVDLDSDQWEARERSTRQLESLGESVEPHLRKVLAETSSLEVRWRIRMLLNKFRNGRLHPPPDRLRQDHAIEVLERIGDASARQFLALLAEGEPAAPLTLEAKCALERLAALTATKR